MTNVNSGNSSYDVDSLGAGWNSPERAQKLVESFVKPGSLVLDIGIGTGQAVRGYKEKGACVVGVDHDSTMIETARAFTGVGDIRIGDINGTMPVDDLKGSVDVVQAIGVLEFATDLEATKSELATTLKDDGVVVFTVETIGNDAPVDERIEHFLESNVTVFRHSIDEIMGILNRTGLNVLKRDTYEGTVVAKRKYRMLFFWHKSYQCAHIKKTPSGCHRHQLL